MCPGVHHNTQTSIYEQEELLLETDDETNGLYLQWVPCMSGTMIQ